MQDMRKGRSELPGNLFPSSSQLKLTCEYVFHRRLEEKRMSKNICPCCHGHSDYLDMPEQTSTFLCTGCEIKLYFPLHEIMEKRNVNKEVAYKILSRNKTCK